MNYSDDDCPGFNDMLWFVARVQHSPKKRVAIEQHIKLCDKCKKRVATMNRWAEEDGELCRQIDALPFPMLKERFEKALAEDNAQEMTVIVERLCETAKLCIDLLTIAEKKAPGIARPHAERFLTDLRNKLNKPHPQELQRDDCD